MNDQTERVVTQFVLRTLSTLVPSDYLFTVQFGTAWDVYKFRSPKGDGTVAFRMVADQENAGTPRAEIGFFRRGTFTAEEVTSYLAQGAPV